MPADIQVSSVQCYCAVQNGVCAKLLKFPRLYDKSSDDFKDTNGIGFAGKMLQKRLVLVLVSEYYSAVFLN